MEKARRRGPPVRENPAQDQALRIGTAVEIREPLGQRRPAPRRGEQRRRPVHVDQHAADPAQAPPLGEADQVGDRAGVGAVEDQVFVGVDVEIPAVIAVERDDPVDPGLLARPAEGLPAGVEIDVGLLGQEGRRAVGRGIVDDDETPDPEPAVVGEKFRQRAALVSHHADQKDRLPGVAGARGLDRRQPGGPRRLGDLADISGHAGAGWGQGRGRVHSGRSGRVRRAAVRGSYIRMPPGSTAIRGSLPGRASRGTTRRSGAPLRPPGCRGASRWRARAASCRRRCRARRRAAAV